MQCKSRVRARSRNCKYKDLVDQMAEVTGTGRQMTCSQRSLGFLVGSDRSFVEIAEMGALGGASTLSAMLRDPEDLVRFEFCLALANRSRGFGLHHVAPDSWNFFCQGLDAGAETTPNIFKSLRYRNLTYHDQSISVVVLFGGSTGNLMYLMWLAMRVLSGHCLAGACTWPVPRSVRNLFRSMDLEGLKLMLRTQTFGL